MSAPSSAKIFSRLVSNLPSYSDLNFWAWLDTTAAGQANFEDKKVFNYCMVLIGVLWYYNSPVGRFLFAYFLKGKGSLSNIVSFGIPQFGLLQYCTYCTAGYIVFENGKYLSEFEAKFKTF